MDLEVCFRETLGCDNFLGICTSMARRDKVVGGSRLEHRMLIKKKIQY